MAPPFLKTRYEQDIRLFPHGGGMAVGVGIAIYIILLATVQKFASNPVAAKEWAVLALAYCFFLSAILYRYRMITIFYSVLMVLALTAPLAGVGSLISHLSYYFIFALAGLSMFALIGLSGQVSLGHGAFMACGAYSAAVLQGAGFDLIISLPLGIALTAFVGFALGLSVGRLPSLFIVIASLAFSFVLLEGVSQWRVVGGVQGMQIGLGTSLFGFVIKSDAELYYLALGVLMLGLLAVLNVQRSVSGRALRAIEQSENVAASVGVNIVLYKALAFAFSAGLMGAAGALYANWVVYLEPGAFDLTASISLLAMAFIGGLKRVHGAFFGAFFIVFLPQGVNMIEYGLQVFAGLAIAPPIISDGLQAGAAFFARPAAETAALGVAIILIARFAPHGLDGAWRRIRNYACAFPLYQAPDHSKPRDAAPVRIKR